MKETFDLAFLGGGPAGYQGAIRAAQLGSRVTVIEEKLLGGVCLNQGCIPTKTVRASAEVGRFMRRAGEFGFKPVEALPDMSAVLARKERVISGLRSSIERLLHANRIEVIEGRGRLLGHGRIEIQKNGQLKLLEAAKIVIATGSRPARLPLLPPGPRVFLSDEILTITYLPEHLLVIGGGAVGVEMAAIFRELGSQVTVVESLERLLACEDAEMSAYLTGILQRRKVKVLCGISVESVDETNEGFTVRLSDGKELLPDTILQAVGRRYNTGGIGLDQLGVVLDRGRLVVDAHLQTNIPGLYGAGDVIGGWMLAHVAFAEGICAAEHALGQESKMDYKVVPRCVFSLPEYAAVGISEEEARASHPVKIKHFPFKSLGMAQAMGELEGLVKIIVHAQTDSILGAHIIGPHAADLVSEIALAMRANLPSRMIMETIHAHPTLSEALLEVAQALHDQAIHIAPESHPS
ncbi:MAG: dihydrolipoyl dehydrogenase [Deltaproteobacteria bacterium]|nr:MAG: dihydrolipoyl dehydrogenase [Deltaproteobacteria bacterium]